MVTVFWLSNVIAVHKLDFTHIQHSIFLVENHNNGEYNGIGT